MLGALLHSCWFFIMALGTGKRAHRAGPHCWGPKISRQEAHFPCPPQPLCSRKVPVCFKAQFKHDLLQDSFRKAVTLPLPGPKHRGAPSVFLTNLGQLCSGAVSLVKNNLRAQKEFSSWFCQCPLPHLLPTQSRHRRVLNSYNVRFPELLKRHTGMKSSDPGPAHSCQ